MLRNRDVILIGAGGHGKVIADILLCSGTSVRGFLDSREGACAAGRPWLGSVEEYRRFPDAEFLIAVGDARARHRIAQAMDGARWHTAIHPRAVVSSLDVEIGEGTVVMAGAMVNPGARIGRHCMCPWEPACAEASVWAPEPGLEPGRLCGTMCRSARMS